MLLFVVWRRKISRKIYIRGVQGILLLSFGAPQPIHKWYEKRYGSPKCIFFKIFTLGGKLIFSNRGLLILFQEIRFSKKHCAV
jgi:hypothetical protein